MTTLKPGPQINRGSITGKFFSHIHSFEVGSGTHPGPFVMGADGFCIESKEPGA